MGTIITIMIMYAAFLSQAVDNGATEESGAEVWKAAEQELFGFLPNVKALGEKHPGDAQIQLGLATLYGIPGAPREYSADEQIKKVLTFDPNNRPGWAMKAKSVAMLYMAQRNALWDQLHGMIENATERGVRELIIPRYSQLYPWLKQEDKDEEVVGDRYILVKDFDSAVKLLQDKLDERAAPILAMLNEGEKQDPENALYNYLRSDIYFEIGQRDDAVAEIQKAVGKKYLNTYFKETRNAVARVLQEIDFPQERRAYIADIYSPFGDMISRKIWRKELVPLARDYEAQGSFDDARKLYDLALRIAKQIREEPLPYPSLYNESFSQMLEKWANEHNKEISAKMKGS